MCVPLLAADVNYDNSAWETNVTEPKYISISAW